jgi:hypothetical protein
VDFESNFDHAQQRLDGKEPKTWGHGLNIAKNLLNAHQRQGQKKFLLANSSFNLSQKIMNSRLGQAN